MTTILNDMTTIELKSSITNDLDLLTGEMLEKVSLFVKQLVATVKSGNSVSAVSKRKTIEITPGVARLMTGRRVHLSDEERNRIRYEHIKKKYEV